MRWLIVTAILLTGIVLFIKLGNLKTPKVSQSFIPSKKVQQIEERTDFLLPDLKIEPPSSLYIQNRNNVKKIRFATTFHNDGKGPLELKGVTSEEEGITVATQIMNKIDGGKEEKVVGEFVFHPGHDHWHVDKYAQFQLWRYGQAGEATELVASTDKYSFCIWDEHSYNLSLENAPKTRQYPRCPENIQGNSVGWGDTYTADLEGQELDIGSVENGKYLVRSIVNADNSLIESDYSNNIALLYIEINGNNVTILNNP